MSTQNEQQLDFQELMKGVRQQNALARQRLVEDYGRYVIRFVRRYQSSELRSKFDPEDYVQEVWKSFFRRDRFLHFENPRVLLGFLSRLAHNHIAGTTLHFLQTMKSNVRREMSLEACPCDADSLESTEPPPWTRVVCQDEIDQILKRTHHHLGHEIIRRLGEGYSQKDTARILKVSEKTVGRIMADIRLKATQSNS